MSVRYAGGWTLRTAAILALTVAVAPATFTALASAQVIRDPSGQPLSCPDPSVTAADVGGYRYYLVCTSENDRNAFPIRASNDLEHWSLLTYAFPAGQQPWWALPSPHGWYWAPSLYRIGGQWVLYFAAEYNPATVRLHAESWVLGVAWSRSVYGPWHSKLLHYRGQFNGTLGAQDETYGGVIDPSMVEDPRTGQRYLMYAEQRTSIWVTELSPNGLNISSHLHLVLWSRPNTWECEGGGCTVEGPSAYYRNGWFYLFYSGASSWSGTYAVGVAAARNPMTELFRRLSDQPILRSGVHWIGPGGESAPVVGPDGHDYLFYHAETRPNPHHVSADRYLLMSRIDWTGPGGYYPRINNGEAAASDTDSAP